MCVFVCSPIAEVRGGHAAEELVFLLPYHNASTSTSNHQPFNGFVEAAWRGAGVCCNRRGRGRGHGRFPDIGCFCGLAFFISVSFALFSARLFSASSTSSEPLSTTLIFDPLMNSVMFLIPLTRSRPHTHPQRRLHTLAPFFLHFCTLLPLAHINCCDYLSVYVSAFLFRAVVAVYTHFLFPSHFGNNHSPYSASLPPHVPPIHRLRTQFFSSPSSHRPTFFPFYGRKKRSKKCSY